MPLPFLATLLPLAQTPEPVPNPSTIATRMVQTFFADPNTQAALTTGLLALGLAVLINILAWWIASKVVAVEEKSSLLNALKLWMLTILVGIGLALVLAIGMALAFFVRQTPVTIGLLAGWTLLCIITAFLLPMRVYGLGFFRAVAFLIITAILNLAGQTAVSRTLGFGGLVRADVFQQMQSLPPEERPRYLREILTGTPADPLDTELDRLSLPTEHAKPFSERQAALKVIFTELDNRFKTLPKDEGPALENYQRLRSRYEKQLAQLRDEFAASQKTPATP